MKIYCLMDDTPGDGFIAEHGLSIYIETGKHRLLVDTGASSKTFENAAASGIDISLADTLILSHGHYDHTGGALAFHEANPKAKIYINKNADGDFYNLKNGGEKYIGADKKLFSLPCVILTGGNTRIDGEISLFTDPKPLFPAPDGNRILVRKTENGFVPDDFSHEQYAVIESEGKTVLVSGCAHRGILNILHEFRRLYSRDPDIVITGFHTVKAEGYDKNDIAMLESSAYELMKFDTVFFTGHCTSLAGFEIMKQIMGEKLNFIHSGDKII